MAAVKLLISGFEASSKSTIASKITDALIINMDRKAYSFAVPHVNITEYNGMDDLMNIINDKVGAYQEKFNKLPRTIVFDTVTQLYTQIQSYNEKMYKGFDVHKWNNKDTLVFNEYVEDTLLANGVNVVIVAHTTWDPDTARHIIPATGQFGKAGSWLSVVNNSIFLEKKSGKIIVHQRSLKFPCRTTLAEIEDQVDSSVFDINAYIERLEASSEEATEFML
jgi:hypothetical protein